MKFKKIKNSPKLLKESFRWPSGKDLDNACDVIDAMLQDRERFELTDEEASILNKAYDIMYWIAPNLSESLKEAANKPVKLYVEFYPYERYGPEPGLKKATISGADRLDALKKLVDHMGLYIDSEIIEEEGYSFEDCINSIRMSNGDGCDFINVLMDKNTGEKFIDEGYNEEEDWDEDFDESLKEAKDVNLSDKGNSISGLLLDHKDEIDSAPSQAELVKVCKNALAEKGGAKAQQFLAVLSSKKNHYAALKYVYDFILAGEGMRSADSRRKTKPAHMKEALEEDFSSEQELIDAGFEQAGYRKNYDFYRKLINGKGKWYAVDTKDGRVFPVTWDQAVGYEPIDSTEGMAMKLGSMLLPH